MFVRIFVRVLVRRVKIVNKVKRVKKKIVHQWIRPRNVVLSIQGIAIKINIWWIRIMGKMGAQPIIKARIKVCWIVQYQDQNLG